MAMKGTKLVSAGGGGEKNAGRGKVFFKEGTPPNFSLRGKFGNQLTFDRNSSKEKSCATGGLPKKKKRRGEKTLRGFSNEKGGGAVVRRGGPAKIGKGVLGLGNGG